MYHLLLCTCLNYAKNKEPFNIEVVMVKLIRTVNGFPLFKQGKQFYAVVYGKVTKAPTLADLENFLRKL